MAVRTYGYEKQGRNRMMIVFRTQLSIIPIQLKYSKKANKCFGH